MYIAPNTNVRLLQNCPIESGYNHTLWFDSLNSQTAYFIGLTKYNLSDYSYQRHTDASIKVGIRAENLYNCNYLMFQNESFGAKWFYAFIRDVEYISNDVSLVTYELDYIQSYLFDFYMGQCFVEREHSATDNVGDNILPEPVELGDYVFNNYQQLDKNINDIAIVIGYSDIDSSTADGNLYDNVFSGVKYRAYNNDDVSSINSFLSKYVESPDSIVIMYCAPVSAVVPLGTSIASGGIDVPSRTEGAGGTINIPDINPASDTLNGYFPKNKKLYTYPYNFLHIDNASASALSLRYEFFENTGDDIFIDITTNVSPPVKVMAKPRQYKGASIPQNESLTLENYPQCSWNMDAYKVWLAQNMIPYQIKAGATIGNILTSFASSIGSGAASGGGIGAASGALSGAMSAVNTGIGLVSQFMGDKYTASIAADMCKGNTNSGNNNIANGCQNFYYGRMSITADYARMIDDFFSMFGYATKRIKTPNRNSRPQWNYVKTGGCIINGSIPADAERMICAIHDRGITYWKNPANYGNYSLDNSPS